jgi:hypothetical protein
MNYASFTDLPASTKFPEDLVDGGRAPPASVGSGRLVALLVLAASVSAYFAAVVNRGVILLYSPDPAKYLLSQKVHCNAY